MRFLHRHHLWDVRVEFILHSTEVSHLNPAETQSDRLTAGSQAALESRAPELLHTAAVDGEDPETRRHLPDVTEGDAGELTAPAECDAATTQDRQQSIAAVLRAAKAAVRTAPDAVVRVSPVHFRYHVFKRHLVIKVIISIHENVFLCVLGCMQVNGNPIQTNVIN